MNILLVGLGYNPEINTINIKKGEVIISYFIVINKEYFEMIINHLILYNILGCFFKNNILFSKYPRIY